MTLVQGGKVIERGKTFVGGAYLYGNYILDERGQVCFTYATAITEPLPYFFECQVTPLSQKLNSS